MSSTLTLAAPVVAGDLGWVAMGVVDAIIVGRLGAEAIGAVGLGTMAFFTVAVFGMGLLLGLDTLVSRSFGAGDLADCRHSLYQGLYLAAALAPPLTAFVYFGGPWLDLVGVNPEVLVAALPYLRATAWGTLPLLIYTAFRRYLQATGRARVVFAALAAANLVNVGANVLLVFGRLGLPALGVEGSGWATTISRLFLAATLAAYALWSDRAAPAGSWLAPTWRPDPARLRRLLGLGLPAATHATLEVAVFGAATALAARLDAAALAAHQIVLNVSSVTFMVPFGLAAAGAVRVGQALGRGDPPAAARAGWTTLGLSVGFMSAAAGVFALAPRAVLGAFTDDPSVASAGLALMYVAAGFQIFDGVQGVTTGNLRGAGDTRTPMFAGLLAYWVLGLPMGAFLAFGAGLGVVGLWLGLSLGLVATATVLFRAWLCVARRLAER
jgi:MATE family multidrug resistance protein